ncbi:MAG: Histidinol dehydrogenase [Alphaproteobacteria bacterium MarineAlpha6_Bin4]|nr:MAG: Histidinol dehydrogenase [Alphaproteobacteria bacterium MarineAlpha6_Bin3]PPR38511.1 MAG: Histidinol dehydrogenase [Alphaproteobacteria bacterium MarineAlpha6_Bin4]|tara:strand:+ start:3013 stop:4305 length:1293 start_codon:yes stop_codon:yes gene_type:complete
MSVKIISKENDIKKFLSNQINKNKSLNLKVDKEVEKIFKNIRNNRDRALFNYAEKFDRCKLNKKNIKIDKKKIKFFAKKCPKEIANALIFSASRIKKFHLHQIPKGYKYKDKKGVVLGSKWEPIDSIGIYVPGGTASYPSSILMNSIPAKIAGVKKISMVMPQKNIELDPIIAKAAEISNIDQIYRVGGAHSIAALAWGTESIDPVDKIVGPGNIYVSIAKKKIFGEVGIDMVAGPSEILVVSDKKNNPEWIAADLLSQAEHDENSRSILITNNLNFAKKVNIAVNYLLKELPRYKIASKSWINNGKIIIVKNIFNSFDIINQLAPEHLELAIDNPEKILNKVNNAGSVFLGRFTPEAIGDYVAGPNHVLPTGRTARFSSGLGVIDFMKKITFTKCNKKSLLLLSNSAIKIAKAEGLEGHALSINIRRNK